MSDNGREDGRAEETETSDASAEQSDDLGAASDDERESDGEEYDLERVVSRSDGAAALRRLADGVANGAVTLGDEIGVSVPERFELELEYERDDEEAELEAELEWPVVDGEAVPAERESGADDSEAKTGSDEEGAGADGAAVTDRGDEDADGTEGDDAAGSGHSTDELVGAGDAASEGRFELYRDRAEEWRWRLVHDNGNIIADSGEGYDRKAGARQGLESVMRNAPGAAVVETNE